MDHRVYFSRFSQFAPKHVNVFRGFAVYTANENRIVLKTTSFSRGLHRHRITASKEMRLPRQCNQSPGISASQRLLRINKTQCDVRMMFISFFLPCTGALYLITFTSTWRSLQTLLSAFCTNIRNFLDNIQRCC